MILKKIEVEVYKNHITNCYIVFNENNREAMVIDPAGDVENIIKILESLQGKLKYIYLTHCHGDHIGGVKELKEKAGGIIVIHKNDAEGLKNKQINLSENILGNVVELEADLKVEDNDELNLGDLTFKVIHTPGHTSGSTCLYCQKEGILFSGDTIFKGSRGRTDLPTASEEAIMNSIIKKLLILSDDTIIYPAHSDETKIKEEKFLYII